MTNKLYLMQRAGRLTCKWVLTGDPKLPLARVWTESSPQAASAAYSTDETARMHLCA
jgi:hypothetical protein